jgi:chromosomal replication initiator protein
MNYQLNDAIRNMHPEMYCTPCDHHNFKVQTRQLSTFEIIDITCNYLKIDKERLISKIRKRSLVMGRYLLADLLYHNKFLDLSLSEVGIIIGGRDHTTVIHGLQSIKNMIFCEPEYKEKIKQLHLHVYHTLAYFKY